MNSDELQLDLLPDFEFTDDRAAHLQQLRAASAVRTRARIHARRAKSEAHLAEILPAVIDEGDAWHILSSGDVDSLSYLAHLLVATPMDYVAFSTWCMAGEDVARLAAWLTEKRIGRLDAYVGEIFPNQYFDEHAALCAAVRIGGGARLRFSQSRKNIPLSRRKPHLDHRILRQHQHQPAHRKHRNHRRRGVVHAPPGVLLRHPQLQPRF